MQFLAINKKPNMAGKWAEELCAQRCTCPKAASACRSWPQVVIAQIGGGGDPGCPPAWPSICLAGVWSLKEFCWLPVLIELDGEK